MEKAHWKGKSKATEQDFNDLDPVITYRHLLQQNLGVRDPLRVIALCDSDAFYAACEMVRLGVMDKPLVVLQWEGIIAVNYPARKYGITRFQNLKQAKECCPELMIVHVATYREGDAEPGYWENVDSRTHKVSLDYYRRESAKVYNMFKEGLPDAEIERASIDEAFIDFTKPVRQAILQRYPYLAQVPHDAPSGVDSPLPPPPPFHWKEESHLIPVHPRPVAESSDSQENAVTEGHIEEDDHLTWHDVALSIAAEMMDKVRVDIATTLGYTTSAGIARNKFLAKLCASYRKPNSQSILRNAAIPNYLKPLEFQKIRNLGGKLGEALAKEYDVSVVADLLELVAEELQTKIGDGAIWVYEILRGIDRSEVKEKPTVNRSMLAAKALQKPITKAADGQHWIRVLAAELALRLNDARKSSPHLWPKTIVLHASRGYQTSRSKQAPFPFSRDVTVDLIATAGNKLWKELVGNDSGPMKVTHISMGFTGIEVAEEGQQSIDEFFASGGVAKRPREEDDNRRREKGPTRENPSHGKKGQSQANPPTIEVHVTSFTCAECRKTIGLPSRMLLSSVTLDEKVEALEVLKAEHSDYHFAQAVAREVEPHVEGPAQPSPQRAKKRRKEKTDGIERFFNRK